MQCPLNSHRLCWLLAPPSAVSASCWLGECGSPAWGKTRRCVNPIRPPANPIRPRMAPSKPAATPFHHHLNINRRPSPPPPPTGPPLLPHQGQCHGRATHYHLVLCCLHLPAHCRCRAIPAGLLRATVGQGLGFGQPTAAARPLRRYPCLHLSPPLGGCASLSLPLGRGL